MKNLLPDAIVVVLTLHTCHDEASEEMLADTCVLTLPVIDTTTEYYSLRLMYYC